MARRPNTGAREQLTAAELAELRRRLSEMPLSTLEIFYKASHNACRDTVRVPSARLIQEFVQAWKQLRKLRGY